MTNLETRLKELEALCAAATPGPWVNAYPNACKLTDMPDHVWSMQKELIGRELIPGDAKLIAAARNELPELIAIIRKMKAELKDACYAYNIITEIDCTRGPECSACELLAEIEGRE